MEARNEKLHKRVKFSGIAFLVSVMVLTLLCRVYDFNILHYTTVGRGEWSINFDTPNKVHLEDFNPIVGIVFLILTFIPIVSPVLFFIIFVVYLIKYIIKGCFRLNRTSISFLLITLLVFSYDFYLANESSYRLYIGAQVFDSGPSERYYELKTINSKYYIIAGKNPELKIKCSKSQFEKLKEEWIYEIYYRSNNLFPEKKVLKKVIDLRE